MGSVPREILQHYCGQTDEAYDPYALKTQDLSDARSFPDYELRDNAFHRSSDSLLENHSHFELLDRVAKNIP